jgi:hypothetical protein
VGEHKFTIFIDMDVYHSFCSQVSTLRRKYQKATIGLKETSTAFHELSSALDEKSVEVWRREEQKAQFERGDALKIYDVRVEQGTK